MELGTAAAQAGPSAKAGAAQPAISVRSVSKSFPVPEQRSSSLRDRVLHPRRGGAGRVEALHDVSLDVRQGEMLGIVGRNGSGKSTLLRCIAGIYGPDSGSISVRGRLAPFVELGAAFDSDASVTDNAVLTSVALGVPRREARRLAPRVVEAAGLRGFGGHPLKNLSSGMTARLAFAATMEVDADVVLLDEVLAVGDRAFRRRCERRLDYLRDRGRTIVLVSHGLDVVRELCDRAALLDRGRLVLEGETETVAEAYEALSDREPNAIGAVAEMPHAPEEDLGDADLQPLALGRSRSSASLAWTLAVARFRRRYLESALGYAWALLRPLAFFAVLYLVFTNIGRFDQGVPHYGLYLLTAIVLWVMFAESTSSSLGSVVRNGRLLRSVPLPPIVLPLSVVISSLLDLAMNLVAVAVFVAASGIEPRWTWLELPAIVGLVAVFATGTGMLLAALFVRLRDIDQVWTVARQALLYGSPIVYVATAYPESVQGVLTAMPLAAAFTEARHALIDPGAPSASELLGGFPTVMVPVAIAVGTLALGILAVSRLGPSAAERA